jgi:hypothetical protein
MPLRRLGRQGQFRNCFGIKEKRAAQGRRSGNHCGRHKILGRFQGTPGLEPRRLYSLFIRLANSALEAGVCQAETEKLYRIDRSKDRSKDGSKDGRKDGHGAKVEEPEEVPGTGNPALLTLAVFTRLSQTSLRLSHAHASSWPLCFNPNRLLDPRQRKRSPMQKARLLALFSTTLLITSLSHAQTATSETLMLDLPRQSQHARVMQRIGITDITVNYHRPLANGRQIWGKLVPYGEVWRAGANENTTITFSDPVTIEGQPLDKGTYGLHMIPGENQWTVIFSKNSKDWGSFTYKQEEDALRVNGKPQTTETHDALAYDFDEVKPDSAVVTMRWDKVAVPFRVEVKVNELVTASIHRQMHGLTSITGRAGTMRLAISWPTKSISTKR